MKLDDYPGSQSGAREAWRALRNIAAGRPAFDEPARHRYERERRREAMVYLYSKRLVRRGAKGPMATDEARTLLARKPPSNAFTEAERRRIMSSYATAGPSKLAASLGRPVGSVENVARKLGVVRPRQRPQRAWSDEEIATLERLFHTATTEELMAALPGRSMNSMNWQAYRRGLRRPGFLLGRQVTVRTLRNDIRNYSP